MVLLSPLLLALAPQSALQVQPREVRAQTGKYEIRVEYPEFTQARPLNAAVRRIVNGRVEEFRRQNVPSGPPLSPGYLHGRYTAASLNNGVVSVLLEWDENVPGAAHPAGYMDSVNYDRRTRRVLTLAGLFQPGADYLSRLSQLAVASLERKISDTFIFRQGAAPLEGNFKVFTLTEAALVLHFPAYQVAAGAAGPQEAVIPLEQLAPLLRKR
jgi:uncharacterized protein DUF3298